MTKFIFITGGNVSSLGKGLSAASIGNLLEARGFSVTFLKLDPYLNVDPGTMNPYQHGEVFVTDDGAETDLDLGHYERFTSVNMSKKNNLTTGKIYDTLIQRERRGDFLGGTVQVVPHVTDEIKKRIKEAIHGANFDVAIVEVGGTVGDIESLPFLEAIRQFPFEVGRKNVLYIHVTLVPYISVAGELKTKLTQHSVNELRRIGIQPDILLCRTDRLLSREMKEKIALFTNVAREAVITAKDVETIYEVPLVFHQEGLDAEIVKLLGLGGRHGREAKPRLTQWKRLVEKIHHPDRVVRIGVVGKYVEVRDSYKSLHEALVHGGIPHSARVEVEWVEAEGIERDGAESYLSKLDGVLVPGGFGARGIEGKIAAIRYARERGIPFFGICLGMQCAVIEFSRNVLGLSAANSSEFAKTSHPVIDLLPGQAQAEAKIGKGGTMRLGAYPCRVLPGTKARKSYGASTIFERHRHRYEVNNLYRDRLVRKGMVISGISPDERLVEMIELPTHPWFVAVQFHPEFRSRPRAPHPLFREYIGAAIRSREKR